MNQPTYHAVGRPSTAFTLQSGSPAINAGTNVCSGISGCSMGPRDFSGNVIPQGGTYDMGAMESGLWQFAYGYIWWPKQQPIRLCRQQRQPIGGATTVNDNTMGTGTNQYEYKRRVDL